MFLIKLMPQKYKCVNILRNLQEINFKNLQPENKFQRIPENWNWCC